MPAPTASLPLSPRSGPPAVIAIPGASPTRTNRRSATNPLAHLSAYVVRDANLDDAPPAAITVAIKARARLLGLSLKGHRAPIVDLEFLPTTARSRVHVLGTCDQEGIVYLWFLYVEKDALGVEKALKLLRDYSFFSLRKSTSAFYSRIRLAGTSEKGTMVLVPNDGSNVRVVTFHCEPTDDPNGKPNLPVIAPPPEVKALPPPQAPPHPNPIPDAPPAPDVPAMPQDMGVAEDEEFVDALGTVVPPEGERPIDVARVAGQGAVDEYVQDDDDGYGQDAEDDDVADDDDQVGMDDDDDDDDVKELTNGHAPVPA